MGDIWNLTTLCRCCHADGKFQSLREATNRLEGAETYEILLRDVFGIIIDMPAIDVSYSICQDCITRLYDGFHFKRQVTACEEKFQVYCKNEQFLEDVVKVESYSDSCAQWDNDIVSAPIERLVKEEIKVEVNFTEEVGMKDEDAPKIEREDEQMVSAIVPKRKHKVSGIKTKIKTEYEEVKKKAIRLTCSKIMKSTNDKPRKKRTGVNNRGPRNSRMKYACEYCTATFSDRKSYFTHVHNHGEIPSDYKCQHCGKHLSSKYALRDHVNSHTNTKIYFCHLCKNSYRHKSTLSRHIKWHNGVKKKKLCDLCGRSFNDKTNLEKHINSVHLKMRPFVCDLCGKTYSAKKHLKAHILVHMDMPSKNPTVVKQYVYSCKTCEQPFRCHKSYRAHTLLHENKYLCRLCSKVCEGKNAYKEHWRMHLPSVSCPLCSKSFLTRYAMRRHLNSHNGYRKHACELCDAKCVDLAQLKRHVSRWHDPNRAEKVQCDICKRFVMDIVKHVEGHNHKNFACEYCGKCYVGKNGLNRHMKVTHFGKEVTCDLCSKNYVSLKSLVRHKMKVHKILKVEEQENAHKVE